VTATDIRPEIVAQARQAGDTASLVIETGSAMGLEMPDRSVEVVHSSLLLHHLEPPEAVKLLAEMGRVATTAVIVNDLDRAHRWWALAWLLSHLATANRYTRHDAPLSVRRAHGPDELVLLAARAGLAEEARRWTFPRYRYAITFRHVETASA
jgi:ubiquinone/menaquinone biosynthesis C-methylase UbiE